MGQDQHNSLASASPSTSSLRPRECLRKGCGTIFAPRCWNQRYCQDAACLKLVRRWQAAKRQRQRRSQPEVRTQRAAAARRQRAEHRRAKASTTEPASRERAWSRSKKFPLDFCDRPGCYDPRRAACSHQARYCGDACCQAVRRVRDRERKWLSRKAAAHRSRQQTGSPSGHRMRGSGAAQHALGSQDQSTPAVRDCGQSVGPSVAFGDSHEVSPHVSETPARARSRAPPTA